ncbi:Hypothetical protein PHPALM_15733 [Phytophthora palmivora]|uniref:Uncharacterized protein n=1 Tax=Phytophthora palmivora TaxID=4796 RepID=A0A2P4XRH8_9STRA|nr:Hypothetical protein PHPALM_15733 [Phytophthora palmivora]
MQLSKSIAWFIGNHPAKPNAEAKQIDEATPEHEEKPIGEETENATDEQANGHESLSENESEIAPSQESASVTNDEVEHGDHEIETEIDHVARGDGEVILNESDGLHHVSPSCKQPFKCTNNEEKL